METDPDRTYEHEEKATVTRSAPLTSSEHVKRKIDLDVSHTVLEIE